MEKDMFYGEECFNEIDYLNINLGLGLLKRDLKNKIINAKGIDKIEFETMLQEINKTYEKVDYIVKTIISGIINSMDFNELEILFNKISSSV